MVWLKSASMHARRELAYLAVKYAFGASTLLVGQRQGHPGKKTEWIGILVVVDDRAGASSGLHRRHLFIQNPERFAIPVPAINFDRQTSIRVSFNALVSVIAPSLSLDHVCGTVSLSDLATSTSPDSSVVRWRRVCLTESGA